MVKQRISQRIRAWLQEGEDILTSLLGIIIAISGLIAFADVFSSGRALAFLPLLLWVWIITQAIAVDYQFYITVKRQFTAKPVDKLVYWIRWILIAVLGALVVVIGAIFAVHESQGAAIDTSMSFLGIPLIVFMYARAASPVLLLFVIAVDHALDRKPIEQPVQVVQPVAVPSIEELMAELDKRIEGVYRRIDFRIEQVTNPQMPAIKAPESGMVNAPARVEVPEQAQSLIASRFASKEQEIARVLQAHPGASVEDVMQAAQCSRRTAEKWMQKYQESR